MVNNFRLPQESQENKMRRESRETYMQNKESNDVGETLAVADFPVIIWVGLPSTHTHTNTHRAKSQLFWLQTIKHGIQENLVQCTWHMTFKATRTTKYSNEASFPDNAIEDENLKKKLKRIFGECHAQF